MTFGERLRAARLQRGLTQRQVADAIGLDGNTVCGYENGAYVPRFETVPALCQVLSVSADWLLGVSRPSPTTERQKTEYRERILDAVCEAFEVRKEDVLGPRRFSLPTAARHAAIWIMIDHLGLRLTDVGALFGGRDHTTILYARNRVDSWREFDAPLYARVQIALSILGASRAPSVPHAQRSPLNPASDTPDGDRASTGRAEASLESFSLFNSLYEAA